MTPERRLLAISFLVDTNCVNARQKLTAMNQLEMWAEKEIIALLTAETAQSEMAAGNNADRKRKAYSFIITMSAISCREEETQLYRIEQALFPNGAQSPNERNDMEIVFNAWKYMRPLITNDGGSKSQPGGILGNRTKLAEIGVQVVTPEEAVFRVEEALKARDDHTRQWAGFYNKEVPEWVGKD